MFDYNGTCFCAHNINREEILQGHDCFTYIFSMYKEKRFIFVVKAAGGVVVGVFDDYWRTFLWLFITTMEDCEKLFPGGGSYKKKNLGPEDEIAFSTIRSYFSQ